MTLIIACVIASSLLIVRRQMERQIDTDLSANLSRSVESFSHLQSDRLAAQRRTGALLADLPSLKALMTTNDQRTIKDGALEFWHTSDSDLFALAAQNGRVVTVYTRGTPATPELSHTLQQLLYTPGKYEVVDDNRLFAVAVHPLFFGSEASGTILGFVYTGFAIDQPFVRQLSQASAVEVSFVTGGRVLASSLPASLQKGLPGAVPQQFSEGQRRRTALGGDHFLTAAEDLSATANRPLQLVLMQSFSGAEQALHRINAFVLLMGLVATLAGAVLMTALAQVVTSPLETLAADVGAFGRGEARSAPPSSGTAEVRELSAAFLRMQGRIIETNAALLESERLATIGRMASSVSHDLRHYLAAIYANAEFLAGPGLTEDERRELYADIRSAVLGTTEMLDSLLLFSRPDSKPSLEPLPVAEVVRRARALAEAHPDAAGVEFLSEWIGPEDAVAMIDAQQMERALFNLLLNACQAERAPGVPCRVQVRVEVLAERTVISVVDNGQGVPDAVRETLFDPFVSEGKQKGTGLGLTLVQTIAQEHGGTIELGSSEPGRTVFRLGLPVRQATNEPADKKSNSGYSRLEA